MAWPGNRGLARGTRHRPSLRRLLAILLGTLALLVGGLILIASLQVRGVNSQTRAENRRTQSFLVADSVRQSSNDLTNMVRLYVASGEPRYRNLYDEILARAGLRLESRALRHVNRRTSRRAGEYFEEILVARQA